MTIPREAPSPSLELADGTRRLPLPRALRTLAWALSALVLALPAPAAPDASSEMKGLDQQVQEIKSEVLSIAAELSLLEEKLLYPSGTQVSVFVALAEGESFRLDSVELTLDGRPVAHHIYTFKELEALQKGGIQRIYTGNVPTGAHRLDVSISGKNGGSDFADSQSFSFEKEVKPKLVGITLSRTGEAIRYGEW